MKKSFTVFFVAGARDGETLGTFETEAEAIRFARQFQEEHEEEFDPCCGGVGIVDNNNNPVEW